MSEKSHPFNEEYNYQATVEREDGYTFDVIASVVNVDGIDRQSIHGIQPHNYREDFPTGLFWASGSLGGPQGEERRGLYPSVSIKPDDPLEIVSVQRTTEPLKSER